MGQARATGGDLEASHQAAAPRTLTAREMEVARMVAAGLRNREIAERMCVSVRTAESHVERIRSKLGFRSRAQIARWIARQEVLAALDRSEASPQ